MGDFDFKSSAPPGLRRATVLYESRLAPPVPPLDLSSLQSYRQLFRLSSGLASALPPDLCDLICDYSLRPFDQISPAFVWSAKSYDPELLRTLSLHYPPVLGWMGLSPHPVPVEIDRIGVRYGEFEVHATSRGRVFMQQWITLRSFLALNPFVPPALLWNADLYTWPAISPISRASLDLHFDAVVRWFRSAAFDPEHNCYVGISAEGGCRCSGAACTTAPAKLRACRCADCVQTSRGHGDRMDMRCELCRAPIDGFDYPWQEDAWYPSERRPGHSDRGVFYQLFCAACDTKERTKRKLT